MVVLSGILSLGKYQEQWLHYRAISEALKSERAKFLTCCGDYGNDNNTSEVQRLCLLVANVEQLLGNEHRQWQQLQKQVDNQQEKSQGFDYGQS